jgi:hypothetical protein
MTVDEKMERREERKRNTGRNDEQQIVPHGPQK